MTIIEKKISTYLKTVNFPTKLIFIFTSLMLIVFVLGEIAYAFGKNLSKI